MDSHLNKYQKKPKHLGRVSFKLLLGSLCCFVAVGILFCVMSVPHSPTLVSDKLNLQKVSEEDSLTSRVRSWLTAEQIKYGNYGSAFISAASRSFNGQHAPAHITATAGHTAVVSTEEPDWSQLFWSPIDIDISQKDPVLTLCVLDFNSYTSNPHTYPMNKDLITKSKCFGSNRKTKRLSQLLKEIKDAEGTPEGRVVAPTGFVFHESRVGSTLVANSLGSSRWAMVFSESAPPSEVLLRCKGCSRKEHVQLFRDVVTVMGRSPVHKYLFFKFQSITTTQMEIALEAFPETNWAFIYRQPVQTMMSHIDPSKGSGGGPCLRGMNNPYEEERLTISRVVGTKKVPKEAWCAARLNMLCASALRAYEHYGLAPSYNTSAGGSRQRGLLVNYEALPGAVARVMLPLFGVQVDDSWLAKMEAESAFYSKGRGTKKVFAGDSEDKDKRSSAAIQLFAKMILSDSFLKLEYGMADGLGRVGQLAAVPNVTTVAVGNSAEMIRDWKVLKPIPSSVSRPAAVGETHAETSLVDTLVKASKQKSTAGVRNKTRSGDKHSSFDFDVDFIPWIPFSNKHDSRPFESVRCPSVPEKGYPQTYPILNITGNWLPDDTDIPPVHYDSLCHFDYQDPVDNAKAWAYREAEVPFVVYNMPDLDTVVRNWHNLDYLQGKLGKSRRHRTETSKDNHFMYWSGGRRKKGWVPPTGTAQVTFESWLETAVKGQNVSLEQREHQYFRATGGGGDDSWIYKELPFFQPQKQLFIVSPKEQRGIHCRFGMRNVVAEAHFDGSRNSIAMIGGLRRWILTHPNQCEFMHMLPKEHPSGRHSEVDWSQPVDHKKFPNFQKIQANEVIMQAGDMLYLPTFWIHYIVSLNVNFQCNTRSGKTAHFDADIRKCGF